MAGILSDNPVDEHALEFQRVVREIICVFEEKTIRYGPFFAICALSHADKASQSSHFKFQWAERLIGQGLSDLRQYEAGEDGYAGLQSTIWRLFCEKSGCGLDISWATALGLIEFEMGRYE